MNTMDTSFDEFFGAFEGTDGNQTDTEEPTAEPKATEEGTDPVEEPAETEGGEPAETDTDDDAEEGAEDDKEDSAEQDPDQKFTIKVNKETREVSLPEMTELAQKGADYDRVKGQLDTSRQNEQTLQAKINEQKPYMDFLEAASEQTGTSISDLVHNLHKNLLMSSKGMSDAEAEAEIRAVMAEKQVKNLTQQQGTQATENSEDDNLERARQEIAEFSKAFPGVQINDELLEKLEPDLNSGMSLTSAYLKQENARLLAQIDADKQKQAADKQNKKNRAKTPGSQKDSGGHRGKDAYDDFFAAFEK